MAGYVCKIVIEGTHPPVWRRVVIPDKITFRELHEMIQILFAWSDAHPHEFRISEDRIWIDSVNDSWGRHYSESVTLIDSFFRNYKWIRYTYDFGDEWKHRVNIERIDAGYAERYATLIKTKGDNFLEDSGGLWEPDAAKRSVFDRESVEKQLKHMTIPAHKELQETKLLKEAFDEFRNMFQMLFDMKPEVFNSVMADTLQTIDDNKSPMTQKIEEWKAFDAVKESSLVLISPSKSQKELLMDLGEKEAADYYKYLRLPQVKILSREEKVSAVSDVLKEHPEYLFYIFDENEYRDLEKWLGYQQGIVFQRPKSKNMLIKLLGLGLGDFVRTEQSGKISLALDIDHYVGVVDSGTKRETYRNLKKFDDRLGKLLQVYGMIELESLYDIYKKIYREDMKKESFFRCIYWHARFNDFVNTVYQLDGTCYVASKELDAQAIMKKTEEYGKSLSYQLYSENEINYMGDDLANRSEWVDIFFTTLHYRLGMNHYEAQECLVGIVCAIMNGDTINQLIKLLEKQSRVTWSLEDFTEIWTVISGLMLELELPMLKGRCREKYAKEQGCSPWSLGMVSDFSNSKNTKTIHMYQFPAEIQEWMYEATSYGSEDIRKQLFAYKKQNHICSEEYLYLLADACISFGMQEKKTEQLIRELKNSSSDGKKAAKHLSERLQERNDVMDDVPDWFEDTGWDRINQGAVQQPYMRTAPKIGRNDPCPCRSGKKYKKCCGRNS